MTDASGRGDIIVASGLVGLALLLGGGSVAFPFQRMVVEIAAVAALGWYGFTGWRAPAGSAVRWALVIIVLTLALMLVQIVPLPPGIWQALPGRTVPAEVFDVTGEAGRWFPISLDPAATRGAIFYFLVPVMVFVATLHLDRRAQGRLVALFVAFAILNAILVTLQAQGLAFLTMYWTTPVRPGVGLFANKNHCAAMLIMAMPAATVLARDMLRNRPPSARYLAIGGVLVFLSLAVVGCLSRAGLALLPVGLGASMLVMARGRMSRRGIVIALTVATIILVTAFVFLPRTHIAAETLARFNTDTEGRYDFWPDVLTAIKSYFPVGSGLGTFVPVFTLHETLENVHLTYTNHAHSDYLEILLETGLAGTLLVVAFLGWLGIVFWHRARASRTGTVDHARGPAAQANGAFDTLVVSMTAILVLLIHSALDYPLRTLTLAACMAMFAAILASPAAFDRAMFVSSRYGRGAGKRGRP